MTTTPRMSIAMNKLDVTCFTGGDDRTDWIGYQIRDGKNGCRAHVIIKYDNLDDMRDYATATGYDGIILGSPSVAWA